MLGVGGRLEGGGGDPKPTRRKKHTHKTRTPGTGGGVLGKLPAQCFWGQKDGGKTSASTFRGEKRRKNCAAQKRNVLRKSHRGDLLKKMYILVLGENMG